MQNQSPHRFATGITCGIAALLLTACSTGGQKLTQSGFLPDYAQLYKPEHKKNVAIWISPDYRPDSYRKVIVDQPQWLAPHRDSKTEQTMRDALRERLVAALSTSHRVIADTNAAPAGTLRVRSAITGIRRTRWFLNAPLQVATFAAGGLGVLAPLRGGGSVEISVDDARSRHPVLQMATYRNGQPWNVKGSYVAYEHARQAFGQAAEALDSYVVQPALATSSAVIDQNATKASRVQRE